MSYNYGPPPPPPQPSGGPNHPAGYQPYGQPYPSSASPPQRGGFGGGMRGRGGGHFAAGRGDFHGQAPHGHSGPPQQHYPNQPPYGAPHQPPSAYPPQQWHPEHGHQPPHQGPPPHAPLPAQNYHPNYAPQIYQQQGTYNQQPPPQPYQAPPPPQQYGQQYPPPQAGGPPPHQQWGPQQPPHAQFGGAGRGGGPPRDPRDGRGGHKPPAPAMGPPIRMGFEEGRREQPHQVSGPYPPHPYPDPQPAAAPYQHPPFQGYGPPPPAPPHAAGPPRYDTYHQGGRQQGGRGGFNHGNGFKSRQNFSGDKIRHGKPGRPNLPNNHQHQKPDAAAAGKKKKRKTNTLGLTPGDESGEEDDQDEEARLTELIGADAPNPPDVAAWIAERRRNFPTQARIQAKLAATGTQDGEKTKQEEASAPSKLEKKQQQADKLRKKLEKLQSSIKRKREQQDEGDEMRDVDESSSDSSGDSKSEDEKPESLPSRPQQQAFLPPPAKKADPTRHCKYYSTGGTCGKKGKCRFVHDASVREAAMKEREQNGGRMTLQQRLILNDKEQEDLTIVATLKYLQDKGLMPPRSPGSTTPNDQQIKREQPSSGSSTSQLPPAPIKKPDTFASPVPSALLTPMHSNTPPVKYNGWNLSGYGNTGVSQL